MLAQTAFHRVFQLLSQMAHIRFRSRKRVHTRLCSKDRTQRITGRNRGCFRWGAITTLGAFRTFTNIPGPGVRTAYFAAFGSWPGGALEERRKPAEQRCAYACRCPEGVAAPLGCVILLPLLVQPDLLGWKDLTKRSGRVTITRNDRTASRLALVQRLRWAVK